jgi:hypothetical protein
MSIFASAALVLAALANAVPTPAALHPERARISLKEADITGAGRETPAARSRAAATASDDPARRSARDWRELAERCRNLAHWNPESRAVLIGLAEEYERRADAIAEEERQG